MTLVGMYAETSPACVSMIGSAVSDVQAFEKEFYQFIETRHAAVDAAIREKKQLDDQLKADLTAAIKEFAAEFAANRKTEAA